jgi:hypothetical protein
VTIRWVCVVSTVTSEADRVAWTWAANPLLVDCNAAAIDAHGHDAEVSRRTSFSRCCP